MKYLSLNTSLFLILFGGICLNGKPSTLICVPWVTEDGNNAAK